MKKQSPCLQSQKCLFCFWFRVGLRLYKSPELKIIQTMKVGANMGYVIWSRKQQQSRRRQLQLPSYVRNVPKLSTFAASEGSENMLGITGTRITEERETEHRRKGSTASSVTVIAVPKQSFPRPAKLSSANAT
ncbi:uncharacterized protein LOC129740072 [Uranotaenia lowii]|uniref:uncharacterized protein LOC129740072 n=1 Tax=Uranotaenia lowii TaxID=190385 RepID=UPI00247A4FB2|nr:uncharacterized protein LOC129740072 [Uranotaenia lowii]